MLALRWIAARIGEAAAAVDGEAVDARVEIGRGSRLIAAGALLLLALPLSAAPRFVLSTSMPVSLLIATLLLLALVALLWPMLGSDKGEWRARVPLVIAFVTLSGIALFLLQAGDFAGFPAESGGDAGNHVALSRKFASDNPRAYEGMTSFYALGFWLRFLGIGDVAHARLAWQLGAVACVIVGLGAGWFALRSLVVRSERFIFALVAFALTSTCALLVAFPFVHYYQAQGFTVQVFVLLPFAVGAVLYASLQRRTLRLFTLVATLVACRFTYVLNVGDLMLAAAWAFVVEARGLAAKPRWALRIVALGLLLVAVLAYVRIVALFPVSGGIRAAPLIPQLLGLAGLALAFAAITPVGRRFGVRTSPAGERLASLLSVLCGIPALLVSAWLLFDGKRAYYPLKYGFNSAVLGSLAALPIVFGLSIALVRRGRTPMGGVAASCLFVLVSGSLTALGFSSSAYWSSFAERVFGPPYRTLTPHVEPQVWKFIDHTLAEERAKFGGLLTPRWPESMFTNAHFNLDSYIEAYHDGAVVTEPGYCVFWYDNSRFPRVTGTHWNSRSLAKVSRLSVSNARNCESFEARGERYSICSRCFQSSSRSLPRSAAGKGFYPVERLPGSDEFRWTNGDAHAALVLSQREAERACAVRVDTSESHQFEIWLGDKPLGPGPRRMLPKLTAGQSYDLRIRSKTFVPSSKGKSKDSRTLGVPVRGIVLECTDEPRPDGPIRVLKATYGRSCGAKDGNRTKVVAGECDGQMRCSLVPKEALGDPFPNCAKDLRVEYRCGSDERTLSASHGARAGEGYSLLLDCE